MEGVKNQRNSSENNEHHEKIKTLKKKHLNKHLKNSDFHKMNENHLKNNNNLYENHLNS